MTAKRKLEAAPATRPASRSQAASASWRTPLETPCIRPTNRMLVEIDCEDSVKSFGRGPRASYKLMSRRFVRSGWRHVGRARDIAITPALHGSMASRRASALLGAACKPD